MKHWLIFGILWIRKLPPCAVTFSWWGDCVSQWAG